MRPISVRLLLVSLATLLLLAGCELLPTTNEVPTVTLTQPGNDADLVQGESVTVEAAASDGDGEVVRVEFRFDGRTLGSAEQAPYRQTFTPEETGSFSVSAQAFDDDDSASEPASTQVNVTSAPPNTFNVNVTVLGDGRVTSEPAGLDCADECGKNFDDGTTVVLTARASAGESFEGWGEDCSGDTCTVTGGARVTATFSESTPGPGPGTGGLESFTLVALPDTQGYVCCDGRLGTPAIFEAQTEWIVENLDSENIAFVTHEGDVVDDATDEQEWRDADTAMDALDGVVPYSVAVGDHEYYPEEFHDGDTSLYREYFGTGRYEDYPWFGGTAPGGLSHYQLFDGGGVDFLHLALEWEAPPAALAWAEGVIEDHPGVPTIITTHAYLRDGIRARTTQTQACLNWSGERNDNGDPDEDSTCGQPGVEQNENAASGEKIFQTLVNPYPQVFMVLGGHYHDNGRRSTNPEVEGCDIDAPGFRSTFDKRRQCNNGEYHQESVNQAGSEVYEMLANYQSYENGGNGWLRIIKFLPGEGTGGLDRIAVETYSPTLNEFQRDSASEFSFDLNFAERFSLAE